MIADNYYHDNETISFSYDFIADNSWSWDSDDFFYVVEHPFYDYFDLLGDTWIIQRRNKKEFYTSGNVCHGIIGYDNTTNETHLMWPPRRHWVGWTNSNCWAEKNYELAIVYPFLQCFFVNKSVGKWLENNYSHPNTSVSGFFEQADNWVEAYNVIGNISIPHSPNDNITVISNRYDGMWSEAPGDSGAGAGIVLGIAKYFDDYDIKPKCNLTFLFTTAEEWGFRGAWHYSHSFPESDYNITRWIGIDQLGFDESGSFMNPLVHDNTTTGTGDIIEAIANETDYKSRTGYGFMRKEAEPLGTDDYAIRGRTEYCDTICIHKNKINPQWFGHHRAGMNYQEGDSMKYIDRDDLNVTFEYVWNITKYFTVNPDCWIESSVSSPIDSDDSDKLKDTVTVELDVKSALPHDLAMVNFTLWKVFEDKIIMSKFMNFSVNRGTTSKSINITLPEGESPGFFTVQIHLYNSTGRINEIVGIGGDNINMTDNSDFFFLHPYNYSSIPPEIANVTDSPDPVGYGFNVTISADVTSNVTTIDRVTVNMSYPDDTLKCFNMSNTVNDTYEYVFNDTWQYGQYDYVIWAIDNYGVENGSSQYSFNVTANVTISVCTIKDSYGDNETVNLTDPPGNIKDSSQQIGYEFLNNGEVLRVWNRFDNYYFNTSNGIQLTNHYNEYWSHNVLMLGYYNNDVWNLIYRTDELSGFNKDIVSDNETYVNITLWKNLEYQGYDFRLAIWYYLGMDDNELTVIPYIKNIDDEDIPYNLGFAWEIKDIQIDMTPEGDYIEINGTTYYLNEEDLDETYKNMITPCFYIREDINGDESESLYLRWNENLNYVVRVESRDGQYNAPVTLGIKIGTLDVGQEKFTKLFWYDASDVVYYFDNYFPGEAWPTNPAYMVDGNTSNYASTTFSSDVEFCDNNTCYGSYLGIISKVEIRAFGYWTGDQRDILLRPVFTVGDGDNHVFAPPRDNGDWSRWFDITNDNNTPASWDWNSVKNLDCDVESTGMIGTVYCSKVEMRVTYTPNYNPVVSNPYPTSGSTDISIQPILNITVSDLDGDNMNITWLSNSSGSWQTFGTNNSVSNDTYHQTFSNASENGKWWYWKVNVSDGTNYTVSDVFSFYTGEESKITNTGSNDIKGYLLIQVQYYNTTNNTWVVVDDTINETSPRTIPWNNPGGSPGQHILALDTIFNGNVNTSNLIDNFGTGKYRVYACLRDPDGNVLYSIGGEGPYQGSEDSSYIVADYEFTVTVD
jgi:hypothetical protein